MQNLKSLVEFLHDSLLTVFLLTIIAFSFAGSLSLSPDGVEFFKPSEVMGIDSFSGEFKIMPQVITRSDLQMRIELQSERSLKLEFFLDSPMKGRREEIVATVVNDSGKKQLFMLESSIADLYKPGLMYEVDIAGTGYSLYDDNGDQLVRDFEVEILPGRSVDIMLIVTANKDFAYDIDFGLDFEKTGISELP